VIGWTLCAKTQALLGLAEQIDKYREDLQRYAKILKAFDGRDVKGGLYFPLLQRWCEVDLNP
jgi:hypothetical protein